MKSYTNIEQSRRLAEILPLESADMKWFTPADDDGEFDEEASLINNKSEYYLFEKVTDWDDTPYIPCCSLAALLDILPFSQLSKDNLGKDKIGWMISVYPDNCRSDSHWHDNPIDACVEMVINLKGLKLL
jgi:hypothetical protein